MASAHPILIEIDLQVLCNAELTGLRVSGRGLPKHVAKSFVRVQTKNAIRTAFLSQALQ